MRRWACRASAATALLAGHAGSGRAASRAGARDLEFANDDARERGQCLARGIGALGSDAVVRKHERQRVVAACLERFAHGGVLDEGTRLLSEVVALHLDALALQPFEIGAEASQLGIDARAANTGRTAHRGVEDSEHRHGDLPLLALNYDSEATDESLEATHRPGLDAVAGSRTVHLASDQSRFLQDLEVLRDRGLGERQLVHDLPEIG